MGAAASTFGGNAGATLEEKVTRLLPGYYIKDAEVTDADVDLAKSAWKMVVDDTSPEFLTLKARPEGFDQQSCLSWFFDQFYVFSAEIDSSSMALYGTNMRVQAKALTGMVNMSLSIFKGKDLATRTESLNKLAKGHCKRGVRSYQYPIVGEIFIKALSFCLGTGYSPEVDEAWKKVFSATIQIVLPAAITEEEALDKETQKQKDADLPESLKAVVAPVTPTTPTMATSASAPVIATVPVTTDATEASTGASAGASSTSASTDPPAVVSTDATAPVPGPDATTTTEVAPVPDATSATVV